MRGLLALFLAFLIVFPAFAGKDESETAITSILFDENMENVSYSLRSDGFADILFGAAVSDQDYVRILERLRKHPDIPGVLAGRGKGNYCTVR